VPHALEGGGLVEAGNACIAPPFDCVLDGLASCRLNDVEHSLDPLESPSVVLRGSVGALISYVVAND